MLGYLKTKYRGLAIPRPARREATRDHQRGLGDDPGIAPAVDAAYAWLGRAQDMSRTRDGGVARDFSLVDGWASSYPETTGYIVPTMTAGARLRGRPELRERARRMLDWLVAIQLPDGSFQAGKVDARPVIPVTFNTGQILLGLADGVKEFGEAYRAPMRRAADWLTTTQDADGAWRRFPTRFAAPGEKVYETHVAWGLLEAARVEPDTPWAEAALRNNRWALQAQHANGWLERCCLSNPDAPLTHTLGYALRGIVEAHLFSREQDLLDGAGKLARGLLTAQRPDGALPGRLDREWRAAVPSVCLTGLVQIAHSWLLLHELTGDDAFLRAGRAGNAYVRRTMSMDPGKPDTFGAVKGSFPVDGDYGRWMYLNWAAKFFIDSNVVEARLTGVPLVAGAPAS